MIDILDLKYQLRAVSEAYVAVLLENRDLKAEIVKLKEAKHENLVGAC